MAHRVNDDFYVVNGQDSNDMGRGTRRGPYRYSGIRPYLLWFCNWHPCYVLVYARSLCDALDEAADDSDDIPTLAALLRGGEAAAKEAYDEAYDAALAAGRDEDKARESGWDASDVDMTPVGGHGGRISSEQWGGRRLTRQEILDLVAETNRRNALVVLSQYVSRETLHG